MNPNTKHVKWVWLAALSFVWTNDLRAEKKAEAAAKKTTPAAAAAPAPAKAPAKAEAKVEAKEAVVAENAEGGEEGQDPQVDVQNVRKLISSQPDPSLVLEPEETPTGKPQPKVAKKAPPKRPVASLPGQAPATGVGGTNAPAGLGMGKPGARFGRLPGEVPSAPEVAIILVNNQFFPSRVRLKEGAQTRLYFTTTNEKTAAIVVEQLQIQRWIAKEGGKKPQTELERARMEVTLEVSTGRVTEIIMDPARGTYSFHDVISGAKGQIIVE